MTNTCIFHWNKQSKNFILNCQLETWSYRRELHSILILHLGLAFLEKYLQLFRCILRKSLLIKYKKYKI